MNHSYIHIQLLVSHRPSPAFKSQSPTVPRMKDQRYQIVNLQYNVMHKSKGKYCSVYENIKYAYSLFTGLAHDESSVLVQ